MLWLKAHNPHTVILDGQCGMNFQDPNKHFLLIKIPGDFEGKSREKLGEMLGVQIDTRLLLLRSRSWLLWQHCRMSRNYLSFSNKI